MCAQFLWIALNTKTLIDTSCYKESEDRERALDPGIQKGQPGSPRIEEKSKLVLHTLVPRSLGATELIAKLSSAGSSRNLLRSAVPRRGGIGSACFLLRPRAVTIAIGTASTSQNVGNTSARRASTISAGTDDAADAQHHRTEEGRHRLHDPHRQACS